MRDKFFITGFVVIVRPTIYFWNCSRLYNFGKLRGASEPIQRYTYGKVYNSQAFTACSNMPRFGHNGILDEQQMKDVTALLLDPDSPVNK